MRISDWSSDVCSSDLFLYLSGVNCASGIASSTVCNAVGPSTTYVIRLVDPHSSLCTLVDLMAYRMAVRPSTTFLSTTSSAASGQPDFSYVHFSSGEPSAFMG